MTADTPPVPSRDDLATRYFDQLRYPPYPVQEEALLAWFSSPEGVFVCAPTGTGKTLIAEAAVYEALHTGTVAYYTTPLVALSEQKFRELQEAAVRWGFRADQVGLVTGQRRVNPNANVLVVVAEILLNRLLHQDEFSFDNVSGVVMDEFHSFNDPERGIVWEFALSLLPRHIRLLLLSATVGNALDFTLWLDRCHQRRLELVRSSERRIPLNYRWIGDALLPDHLETMAQGDADTRYTPALVFCFNRDECWSLAEELKGRSLMAEGQQKQLTALLADHTWNEGVGPKLKQLLVRGVGVHHAGVLPRYKRIVEDLFQRKLLSICVCTETLAAGINLPARSVVLPSLLKGPYGKQKVIDASSAQQIFGRAGRPQFDTQGFVFALPHEDDVRILRWKEKYDQIPEDCKDPLLIRAKKALKKKQPTRNPERQYWTDQQFEKLRTAPAADLASRGPIPWRLLAYLLLLSPEIERIRQLIRQRLLEPKQRDASFHELDRMLITLHDAEFVELTPPPPARPTPGVATEEAAPEPVATSWLSQQLQAAIDQKFTARTGKASPTPAAAPERPQYIPLQARPTERLPQLFSFRSIHPLYGSFLLEYLGYADPVERIQLLESVLTLPWSMVKHVRVPPPRFQPPGPLAVEVVDQQIIERGILAAGDLYPEFDPDIPFEERKYAPPLAEKMLLLFRHRYPDVHDVTITPVWVVNDLVQFSGQFFKYVSGRDLAKQEGLIFRHILRMVMLLGEFAQVTPVGADPDVWRRELKDLAAQLTETCRAVDPQSTEQTLAHTDDVDALIAEPKVTDVTTTAESAESGAAEAVDFGLGLFEE